METRLRIAKNRYRLMKARVDRAADRLEREQKSLRDISVEINDLTTLIELNKAQQIEENTKEI